MQPEIFWALLEEISGFGDFIAAVTTEGASANLVGTLASGRDGREKVLLRKGCGCHIHLDPEKIARFVFLYRDAGFGDEPCIELHGADGDVAARLFFTGGGEKKLFNAFVQRQQAYAEWIGGGW